MNNFEWCVYTYKHRIAFKYVAQKLIKDERQLSKIMERQKYHDLDKQLMYLFLDWNTCINYHIMHQPHHLENDMEKSEIDLLETVIDFECAPYTKPDKPLNAFDFVHKLSEMKLIDKDTFDKLICIMRNLGIDHSYDVTKTSECKGLVESFGEITEEMILMEVMEFVNDKKPEQELKFIREKLNNQK